MRIADEMGEQSLGVPQHQEIGSGCHNLDVCDIKLSGLRIHVLGSSSSPQSHTSTTQTAADKITVLLTNIADVD